MSFLKLVFSTLVIYSTINSVGQNNLGEQVFKNLQSLGIGNIWNIESLNNYNLIHYSSFETDSNEYTIMSVSKEDLTIVNILKFKLSKSLIPVDWKLVDSEHYVGIFSENKNTIVIMNIHNNKVEISKNIKPFIGDTTFSKVAILNDKLNSFIVLNIRDTTESTFELALLQLTIDNEVENKKTLTTFQEPFGFYRLSKLNSGYILGKTFSTPGTLFYFDLNWNLTNTIHLPIDTFSNSDTTQMNRGFNYVVNNDNVFIHGDTFEDTLISKNGNDTTLSGVNTYFGRILKTDSEMTLKKDLSFVYHRDNRRFRICLSLDSGLYISSLHSDKLRTSFTGENIYSATVIRKLSPDGKILWERSILDTVYRFPSQLQTNENNDLVVTGTYNTKKLGDTSNVFIFVVNQFGEFPPLGIENRKVKKLESLAYPNPTSNSVFISWNTSDLPKATFMLFNLKGQIIKEEVVERKNFIEFETLNYENGLYPYIIQLENGQSINGKIIIQH